MSAEGVGQELRQSGEEGRPGVDTDHGLRGGQVWRQEGLPCMTCYLVYCPERGETDRWCRIGLPSEQGNIAWTDTDGGGPFYTGDEMAALLRRHRFTLVGSYADLHNREPDFAYESGRRAAAPTSSQPASPPARTAPGEENERPHE